MANVNDAEYSLDASASSRIERLRKDDLWSLAAQRLLLDCEEFVAAVD
ncbi:hypothetical protein SNOG_07193 [Parastagonospora nodorum SN15]|uniref:Uncharacterized protein n=1 Tax=Phaeosphaeria nodorum (strain SN15 / ATCC MYA-4574 / FGSC 10173) TaxID=321614 RepID=Q0UM21_PHANO|nr:hypothetical protein SNOG_07193 [Parastagonospora nodorum SN15]EAT85844.1 hypothetical protein SNOG_07193 [Parastagonospora nodorum SN15]